MTASKHSVAIAIVLASIILAIALLVFAFSDRSRSEAELIAMIDARIEEKAQPTSDAAFNARVEQGIMAFIDKQRRAEAERPNTLAANVPPPAEDEFYYGSPDARITLIEYSDFECPFCKRFHQTAKALVDGSDGKVNWVYRHFPLDSHNPGAQRQAEAAECAGELGGGEAFWAYTDAVYERTSSGGRGFAESALAPLAVELGLRESDFIECLNSRRHADKVRAQMAAGMRAGVTGTPGNILYDKQTGNVLAVHGAQPLERLRQAAAELVEEGL